jgi:hypothetical protein
MLKDLFNSKENLLRKLTNKKAELLAQLKHALDNNLPYNKLGERISELNHRLLMAREMPN